MNNKWIRYWLPVLAHMALIYYLSSRSSFPVEVPPWAFYADKVVHAVIFGFLGFLFLRAWLQGKWQRINLPASILTVGFILLYGISDEVHQMFVPNRHPSIGDIAADITGAAFVVLLVFIVLWIGKQKKLGDVESN